MDFLLNWDWWTTPLVHMSQQLAWFIGYVSGVIVGWIWWGRPGRRYL